jgi:hypothetical protein
MQAFAARGLVFVLVERRCALVWSAARSGENGKPVARKSRHTFFISKSNEVVAVQPGEQDAQRAVTAMHVADREMPGHEKQLLGDGMADCSDVPHTVQIKSGLATVQLHTVASAQAVFQLSTGGGAEQQKLQS